MIAAVIGNPISHSLSPQLFRFIHESITPLSFSYHPLLVEREDLATTLRLCKQLPFLGLNVTLPHKESILPFLDELSLEAKEMQAVNVVQFVRENGLMTLRGSNTDAWGVRKVLEESQVELLNHDGLCLGTGGAARALIYAFGKLKARKLAIMGRRLEKAEELCAFFRPLFPHTEFLSFVWGDEKIEVLDKIKIVANTTSVGLAASLNSSGPLELPEVFPWDLPLSWHHKCFAFDAIYNPYQTSFLSLMKEAGSTLLYGVDMFAWQAIGTLNIWENDFFKKRNLDQGQVKAQMVKFLRPLFP